MEFEDFRRIKLLSLLGPEGQNIKQLLSNVLDEDLPPERLAEILITKEEFLNAVEDYVAAREQLRAKKNELVSNNYRKKGQDAVFEGRPKEAEALYRKSLAWAPTDSVTHTLAVAALCQLEDKDGIWCETHKVKDPAPFRRILDNLARIGRYVKRSDFGLYDVGVGVFLLRQCDELTGTLKDKDLKRHKVTKDSVKRSINVYRHQLGEKEKELRERASKRRRYNFDVSDDEYFVDNFDCREEINLVPTTDQKVPSDNDGDSREEEELLGRASKRRRYNFDISDEDFFDCREEINLVPSTKLDQNFPSDYADGDSQELSPSVLSESNREMREMPDAILKFTNRNFGADLDDRLNKMLDKRTREAGDQILPKIVETKMRRLQNEDTEEIEFQKFTRVIENSTKLVEKETLHFTYESTREIKRGDVILKEEADFQEIHSDLTLFYCLFCGKRAEIPHPCLVCSEVVFCSERCRSNCSYHEGECGYLDCFINTLGHARLPLRHIIKMGIGSVLWETQKFEGIINEQYSAKLKDGYKMEAAVGAVLSLLYLRRRYHAIFQLEVEEKFKFQPNLKFLLKLLVRLYQRWFVNGQTIPVLQEFRHPLLLQLVTGDGEPELFGVWRSRPHCISLFRNFSFFGHHCVPNLVARTSENGRFVVCRATRDIGVGETLTVAYDVRNDYVRKTFKVRCPCEYCKTSFLPLEEVLNTAFSNPSHHTKIFAVQAHNVMVMESVLFDFPTPVDPATAHALLNQCLEYLNLHYLDGYVVAFENPFRYWKLIFKLFDIVLECLDRSLTWCRMFPTNPEGKDNLRHRDGSFLLDAIRNAFRYLEKAERTCRNTNLEQPNASCSRASHVVEERSDRFDWNEIVECVVRLMDMYFLYLSATKEMNNFSKEMHVDQIRENFTETFLDLGLDRNVNVALIERILRQQELVKIVDDGFLLQEFKDK